MQIHIEIHKQLCLLCVFMQLADYCKIMYVYAVVVWLRFMQNVVATRIHKRRCDASYASCGAMLQGYIDVSSFFIYFMAPLLGCLGSSFATNTDTRRHKLPPKHAHTHTRLPTRNQPLGDVIPEMLRHHHHSRRANQIRVKELTLGIRAKPLFGWLVQTVFDLPAIDRRIHQPNTVHYPHTQCI